MAKRGIYTDAEKKMIENFKRKSASKTGWVGETPSELFPYPAHKDVTKELIWNMATVADFKNPLYRDENYARNTRWGGIIAPPFYYHSILHGGSVCFLTMPPEDGLVRSERVLMIQQGDFYQTIRPGDKFRIWLGPTQIEDITKDEEDALRQFKLTRVVSYINQRDEVVCSNTDSHFYTVYPPADKDTGSFQHFVMESKESDNHEMEFTKEFQYSKEDIAAITAMYAKEERRAADTLYWEDVEVGEELPSIVQGPYTTWDAICSLQGFGGAAVTINDLVAMNADTVLNDPVSNIPHNDIELHVTESVSKAVHSYSTTLLGPPILHFFSRLVTNWAGDDGFIRRLTWRKLANTPVGDAIFGKGRVVRKYVEDGEYLVDIDVWMEDCRGFISNVGPATVSLVSRKKVFEDNEPPKFNTTPLTGPYTFDTGRLNDLPDDFKEGDRVRIKEMPQWPLPSGYPLTGQTATISTVVDDPSGYVLVMMDENATGIDTKVPLGFRTDQIEKI